MICPFPTSCRAQRGMAVIVVLAILAIVTLYIAANLHSLRNLHRDLKLVEQRQLRHWNSTMITTPPAPTNSLDRSTALPTN